MTARTPIAVVAAALGIFAVACAPSNRMGTGPARNVGSSAPPTTYGPISPPPAEVLDATVVYFDADGIDRQPTAAPLGLIADEPALAAFVARDVDGDPALGTTARDALGAGRVLIGAPVSRGCAPAADAVLAFTAADVRLLPVGFVDDDPDVECVRAITSIALVAIERDELPAGLPIRGT